jgi:hypothetical protein
MAYDLIFRRQIKTDYSRGSKTPPDLKTTLFQLLFAIGAVAGSEYYRRRRFEKENAIVREEIQDSLNLTQRLPSIPSRKLVLHRATQP